MNLAPTSLPRRQTTLYAASGWLVGCKQQREVIGDFEAVRLQPHTTVGKVFNQARMFLPLSKHDCGHTSERMAG